MNPRSLEEDLLSIAGVEGAEVEGTSDKPAGLRIRIAEGADQAAVGSAIRRVLSNHGLGTDTRLPGEASETSDGPHLVAAEDTLESEAHDPEVELDPDASPAAVALLEEEPSEVIDLTDDADDAPGEDLADASAGAEPVDEVVEETSDVDAESDADAAEEPTLDQVTDSAAEEQDPVPEMEPPAPVAPELEDPIQPSGSETVDPVVVGVARIAAVAVEEGRDGIRVTVTSTDGTSVTQVAASSEGGVESAVVRATARLARPESPEALVVDVDDRRIEGVDIVMIVLDLDGEILAGSAVVGAGRSFALGRATWAALSL